MSASLTVTRDNITPTLLKFGKVMRQPLQRVVTVFAQRTTREVIAITPPASAGTTGRDAYNQGRSRIHRDLIKVLAPRTLKRKRKEQHPDIEAAYRQRRVFRDSGVGARTGRGALAYVDRQKFLTYEKLLWSRIGRMAAGWSAAAIGLRVALPAWIARHGTANGRIVQIFSGSRIQITVTNFAPTVRGNVRAEMARRIPYAQRYAIAGMARNVDHVVLKTGGQLGLRVNRSMPGGSMGELN